jgi:5'-3' exonuclease
MDIDYIVAPFEADAQLAYLELQGIIQGIITEDSDLVVFGCKEVFIVMIIHRSMLMISNNLKCNRFW